MTKDEALRLALEALEASHFLIHGSETKGGLAFCMDGYYSGCFDIDSNEKKTNEAITAIKEALAQREQDGKCKRCTDGCPACDARKLPEQELVCVCGAVWEGQELVETPQQRTWVGLTDEEREEIALEVPIDAVCITEARLKDLNT